MWKRITYVLLSVCDYSNVRIEPYSCGGVAYRWNLLENFDEQDTNSIFLEPWHIPSEDIKEDVNPVCPQSS